MTTEAPCQHKLYQTAEDTIINQKRFKIFNYEFQNDDGTNNIKVGDKVNFRLIETCACCKEKVYTLHSIEKK